MKTAAPQLASVILLSLLAQACGDRNAAKPPAPKFPVTVEVSDNTFRNDYFGMTAKKPESWRPCRLTRTFCLLQKIRASCRA